MAQNGVDGHVSKGIWYPGALAPNLFYLEGNLSGMVAGIPRIWGEPQKWEAYDMRQTVETDSCPVFLGQHESLEMAKRQIEDTLEGATT